MTNETGRAIGGAMISGGAALASWATQIEQFLRMGASAVAILSGLVVIWSVIRNQLKKKGKHETSDES